MKVKFTDVSNNTIFIEHDTIYTESGRNCVYSNYNINCHWYLTDMEFRRLDDILTQIAVSDQLKRGSFQ